MSNPYLAILQPYQAELQSLAVPGELLRARRTTDHPDAAPCPAKLQGRCAHCGDTLARVAQFWAHGRLWALDYCVEWMDHTNDHVLAPMAYLRSVSADEAGLVEGQEVAGNDGWERFPVTFIPNREDPRWLAHPVLADLAGFVDSLIDEPGGDEAFDDALAELIGAIVPGSETMGPDVAGPKLGFWARCFSIGRLGGTESPVQFSQADACCRTCKQPMTFLGQFDEDTGFFMGDGGVIYARACLDHPDQVQVDCQSS